MDFETPEEAFNRAWNEKWSAADWFATIAALVVGSIVVGVLQAIAKG